MNCVIIVLCYKLCQLSKQILHRWHLQKNRDCSCIDLLNKAICDQVLTVDTHCQCLEDHLRQRASAVSRNVSMRSGSRTRYLESNTVLDVQHGEKVSASSLLEELDIET